MSSLSIPNSIANDTPADAVPVDANYVAIRDYINLNAIVRDGATSMSGQLTLVGDPESANHAVRKQYVDSFLPVGIMLPWLGLNAPAGRWALANGAVLQINEYQTLYNVISTRFGSGGAGTFKLPNMAGVVPVGQVPTPTGGTAHPRYATVGNYGGSVKVPVPSHVHKMDHNHPQADTALETQLHQHPIDHNHGSATTKSGEGTHNHSAQFSADLDTSVTGAWAARRSVDTGTTDTQITVSGGGAHTHTVDLPNFDGNSQSQNAKHTHKFDVPNFVGNTAAYSLEVTDDDGKKSTTDFYAPFVVIQYIVRIT